MMAIEVPTQNPDKALDFYQKYLLYIEPGLDSLLNEYRFRSVLPSWKWEMFVAILVGDIARERGNGNGRGSDLLNHEVKSAAQGNSFEYQYHKDSWKENLQRQVQINHVFISYWNNYSNLDVRIMAGSELKEFFTKWELDAKEIYDKETPGQRCRKQLPFKMIIDNGKLIFSIRDGKNISQK